MSLQKKSPLIHVKPDPDASCSHYRPEEKVTITTLGPLGGMVAVKPDPDAPCSQYQPEQKITITTLGPLGVMVAVKPDPDISYYHYRRQRKIAVTKKGSLGATLALICCLESCKSSKDALQTLLRISDGFHFRESEMPIAVRKLCQHFSIESETAVRVKVMSLLGEIGQAPDADATLILDEVIRMIEKESSHKVIGQAMKVVLKLSKFVEDLQYRAKLLEIANEYVKDVSQAVKCTCLELISTLTPVSDREESKAALTLINCYFNDQDARVRAQAFSSMNMFHERGFTLNPNIYSNVCKALQDDYESVRAVVLQLVCYLGNTYPETVVFLPHTGDEVRMVDDAFEKICKGVNDLSMHVRIHAYKLLGSMTLVSQSYLDQTLDKKLKTDARRKSTAHELAWEAFANSSWAPGKTWVRNGPRESLNTDNTCLMSNGACGAFVHGIEDEYLEVRSAAIESMCKLSLNNMQFSHLSLDYLVDMFNDEIEEVRLKAIDSLRIISAHITLRDDQLETILVAVVDSSQEVREGLHRMLATCTLSTTDGLKICIERLIDNLRRYPQDYKSMYMCVQKLGDRHPELVFPLVPYFLNIHPFFDMAECNVDSPQYICIMILVVNAAKHLTAMFPLLDPQTRKHYSYLRDMMPDLVPQLSLPSDVDSTVFRPSEVPESMEFLNNLVANLNKEDNTIRVHVSLLEASQDHLMRLSGKDSTVSGTAQFTYLYTGAQLLMWQILEMRFWSNSASVAMQQSNRLKTSVENLLLNCLKLQHIFTGLKPVEICLVKQLWVRALGLNVVYVSRGTNQPAIIPYHYFLSALKEVQLELMSIEVEPDSFISEVWTVLTTLEDKKPAAVANMLLSMLTNNKFGKVPDPSEAVNITTVKIYLPNGKSDSTLRFPAGLILAVPLGAEILKLLEPGRLRVKVKFPDMKVKVILPRLAHMKPLHMEVDRADNACGRDIRLRTNVMISQVVWTEACFIELSLALAVPEGDLGNRMAPESHPYLIDLCKPVKISIFPHPTKRIM